MSKTPVSLSRITTALIFLTLSLYILSVARSFFIPLAFGVLFAFVLLPVCNFLERFLKSRIISIFVSFLAVLAPLIAVISFFGFEFVRLVNGIPSIGKQLKEGLYDILNWSQENLDFGMEEATQWLRSNISTIIDTPLSFITSSLSSSTTIMVSGVLVVLYTFFMLWYRTSIRNFFIYQFGENTRDEAEEMLTGIQKVMQEYLSGLGLVMLILGILNSTGLWIIGINYPFFWGFLGAFLAIVPYIGTALGGILPFLYALATTDTFWQPAAIVVMYLAIQQLEGNLITPKVVGSSVQINPLAAIIALFAGGFLWGIAGLILAIPIMAALRIMMLHIDYLKPVGELLGERLYRNSHVFKEKYDDDRYRLISFFRKVDREED